MYIEKIISPYIENNQIVLDLCAAPGGKSTHLANLITKDSLLICNEALPGLIFFTKTCVNGVVAKFWFAIIVQKTSENSVPLQIL